MLSKAIAYSCRRFALAGAAVTALVLLATGPVVQAEEPLFQLDGKEYRMHEIPSKLRNMLARQEAEHYRERRDLLEQIAFDRYLEEQAASTGRTRADLSRELLAIDKPTEADAKRFYEANKGRIAEDFEQVKERILRAMSADRVAEKKRAVVARLERSKALTLDVTRPLPPPVDLPIKNMPAAGPDDAPITIVEFADFSCPLCQRASKVMYNLLRDYPDKVRWVFFHYPVGKRGIATKIHEGGQCLIEQDLFWQYHDLVFERMDTIKAKDAPNLAEEVGADMDRFEACYTGKTARWAVKRALDAGRQLRVTRTPTLFVNGRPFSSARMEEGLREIIDASTGS